MADIVGASVGKSSIVTVIGGVPMRVTIDVMVHRRGHNGPGVSGDNMPLSLLAFAVADMLGASVGRVAIVSMVGGHYVSAAIAVALAALAL